MEKLFVLLLAVLLTGTLAFAGGGQNTNKNQGNIGQGETSTG